MISVAVEELDDELAHGTVWDGHDDALAGPAVAHLDGHRRHAPSLQPERWEDIRAGYGAVLREVTDRGRLRRAVQLLWRGGPARPGCGR